MRKVERSEIVDYLTYEDSRDETRDAVILLKQPRRIHVGEHLTFLFENQATVRYQVQEMMRAERLVRETEIQHELATYNELLGGPGELGCTLMIEIDDEAKRAVLLREWLDLPKHLYALVDGRKVRASYDERQVGEDRVSSVQYLKFEVGGKTPSALGCDHPKLTVEVALGEAQQAALGSDLAT